MGFELVTCVLLANSLQVKLLERLKEIRATLEQSEFFKVHEVIGKIFFLS